MAIGDSNLGKSPNPSDNALPAGLANFYEQLMKEGFGTSTTPGTPGMSGQNFNPGDPQAQYLDMTNPYGQVSDPYNQFMNPYGQFSNPYASPFGAGSNPEQMMMQQEMQALTNVETQQGQEIQLLSQEMGLISQELGAVLKLVDTADLGAGNTTPPEVQPPSTQPVPPPEVQPPTGATTPPPEVQPPSGQPSPPADVPPSASALPTDAPGPSSSLGDSNPPWDVGWNNALLQKTGAVTSSAAVSLDPNSPNKMYSDVGMNVYAKPGAGGDLSGASFNFRGERIVFDGSGPPHAISKDGTNVPLDGSVPGVLNADGSYTFVPGYLAPGIKNASGAQEKIEGGLIKNANGSYQIASGSAVFEMVPDGKGGWTMTEQNTNLQDLYQQNGLDFPAPTGLLTGADVQPPTPVPPEVLPPTPNPAPPPEVQPPSGATPPTEAPGPSSSLGDANPPWDIGYNNALLQKTGILHNSSDVSGALPANQWSSLYSDVGMNVYGEPGNGDMSGLSFNFRGERIVFDGSGAPHAISNDGTNVPLDGSVPGVLNADGSYTFVPGYLAPGIKNASGVPEKIEAGLTRKADGSYEIASGSGVFDITPNGQGGWNMTAQQTNLQDLYLQNGLNFPAPTGPLA